MDSFFLNNLISVKDGLRFAKSYGVIQTRQDPEPEEEDEDPDSEEEDLPESAYEDSEDELKSLLPGTDSNLF